MQAIVFSSSQHRQEILYLGETTRIISFQTQHLHCAPGNSAHTAKSGCTVRPVYTLEYLIAEQDQISVQGWNFS